MGMGAGPGLAQGGHDGGEERRGNKKPLQTLQTKRQEGERKIREDQKGPEYNDNR